MRRITLTLAVVIAALASIAAPTASAAGPTQSRFAGVETDPDFCGTGMSVNVEFTGHVTFFEDPNQSGIDERLMIEARTVFTNPLNGETVIGHLAGQERYVFPADPGRVIATSIGLRAQLVHQGQDGLLSRDAGYVVFDFTFNLSNGQILVERGPHPNLDAIVDGTDNFCPLMTTALGLG